jgi:small subunit ribosomal protein S21
VLLGHYFLLVLVRLRRTPKAERVFFSMLRVKSRTGESVQQMIRRFKKLCEKEGLIRDMKRMAYYEKPSEKNRRRMRKAQRMASISRY